MRTIFFVFLVSMTFQSCSNSDSPMMDDNNMTPEVLFEGNFVSSAHPTSGKATINNEKTMLSLTNFKTDSGPSLEIYLAKNLATAGTDYISLGAIKGVNGTYQYAIPINVDFAVYNHVVVWCVPFSVNFGYAVLN